MSRPARAEDSSALADSETQGVALGLRAAALSAQESKSCKSEFTILGGWPFMKWLRARFPLEITMCDNVRREDRGTVVILAGSK
jgi:hypothetical protein